MKTSSSRERGSVLVTTLVLAMLVGMVVAALLFVAREQNTATLRSATWGSEIPTAEAGVEEAMAHLNGNPTNLASKGWSASGTNFTKTRTIGDDYFYAEIRPSNPPTIVSVGYGRLPLQTNYSQRTVGVTTSIRSARKGLIAKTTINMNGGAWINSYDSSDPNYSTGGLYDTNKPKDGAFVASISGAANAINTGSGYIYGNVATGAGGTAVGNVGDGTWLPATTGIQSGHFADDFNMAITDASVPFAGGVPLPAPVANIYTLTGDDYKQGTSLTIGIGKGIVVASGRNRIYFTTSFSTSGSGYIKIMPGATLELYFGGTATFSGAAIVNNNPDTSSCSMFGLPTCTTIAYSGSSTYIGSIYAPNAAVVLSGSAGACGLFLGKSFNLSGGMNIHLDEALMWKGGKYEVASWQEL